MPAFSYEPPGTYTLEGDYRTSGGSVQAALQAAVNDILLDKGGGRLLLGNQEYDFDSITWPMIGFDQPTPAIEIAGPFMPQTAGFMPGVGLTVAQGSDMPAPTHGAILKASQASGSAFGNISGGSNLLAFFRDVVVRVPANPQQHGIDAGWLTNLVCERVVVDQGRSWGDGSNPLSPGPILQPTNAGVYGIIYPGPGNGGVSRARDVLVTGFYHGLIHSEHFDGDRVVLAKNVIGLLPRDGWHASRIGRLSTYWNAYDVQPINQSGNTANPCTRLKIDQWDTEEDPVGGNWYTTVYHLNDPGNYLRGEARTHRLVPAAGPSLALLRRGGAYYCDSTAASPGRLVDAVGFEGANSATVLPNSWAGQAPAQRTGVWGISSQLAYIATPSGGNAGDQAVWETGLTNFTLSCRVTAPTNGAPNPTVNLGLALFSVDTANWMSVFLVGTGTNVVSNIQKSNAGAWTNLSGNSANIVTNLVNGMSFDVKVSVIGKTVRAFVNGSLTSTYTMTAAEWTQYSASTSHGFVAWTGAGGEPGGATGGRWDALRVEPARVLTA